MRRKKEIDETGEEEKREKDRKMQDGLNGPEERKEIDEWERKGERGRRNDGKIKSKKYGQNVKTTEQERGKDKENINIQTLNDP